MYLVRELEPFVKSRATMFGWAPFKLRKAIGLVLYQLAYGVSANIIANRSNVGAFTVCKYVDIIVKVLISRDELLSWYIFIPYGPRLLRIMDGFFHTCGNIDGFHISLPQKLDKRVTTIPIDYHCRWKSCNLVILQAICDMDKLFWNFFAWLLAKQQMGANLRCHLFITNFEHNPF